MPATALELLRTRRSAKAALLSEPGPSPAELDTILGCAARVPDHKRVVPWRFILFEGDARRRFGEMLARVLAEEDKEAPSQMRLETERGRLLRAPTVVCVVSRVTPTPGAPEWGQVLSC